MKTTKTLTINKGNQYSPSGYRISDGVNRGWGSYGKRMDGSVGLTRDGRCYDDSPDIQAAIMATLADGYEREIVIDEPESKAATVKDGSDGRCPKCGTWCEGDCQ